MRRAGEPAEQRRGRLGRAVPILPIIARTPRTVGQRLTDKSRPAGRPAGSRRARWRTGRAQMSYRSVRVTIVAMMLRDATEATPRHARRSTPRTSRHRITFETEPPTPARMASGSPPSLRTHAWVCSRTAPGDRLRVRRRFQVEVGLPVGGEVSVYWITGGGTAAAPPFTPRCWKGLPGRISHRGSRDDPAERSESSGCTGQWASSRSAPTGDRLETRHLAPTSPGPSAPSDRADRPANPLAPCHQRQTDRTCPQPASLWPGTPGTALLRATLSTMDSRGRRHPRPPDEAAARGNRSPAAVPT